MSNKKKYTFDQDEIEEMMKQLKLTPDPAAAPDADPSYFNPWNMSKKKTSMKRKIFAALPEEIPEE